MPYNLPVLFTSSTTLHSSYYDESSNDSSTFSIEVNNMLSETQDLQAVMPDNNEDELPESRHCTLCGINEEDEISLVNCSRCGLLICDECFTCVNSEYFCNRCLEIEEEAHGISDHDVYNKIKHDPDIVFEQLNGE